jgi:OOP family OmpA-OmpF porin
MRNYFIFVFILLSFSAKSQYRVEGNQVVVSDPVLFESGSAVLKPESEGTIATIKKYLDDKPYISLLRVEAHTDNEGNAEANDKLSEQRALAVCKALVKLGVDCKRLIAVGFGGSKPVEDNSTPTGKSANRRIVFVNAAIRGHLIGGMPSDGGGIVGGEPCN